MAVSGSRGADGSEALLTDGAAAFAGGSAHVALYDLLYGRPAEAFGDLAYYAALAEGRARILDAACGTGRIALSLAAPGRRVMAFDASPELLTVAGQHAVERGLDAAVAFRSARLESFVFDQRFDLIILGYYALSYVLDEPGRLACLQQVRAHLADGGLAVVHLPDPDLLRRPVPEVELDSMRFHAALPDQAGRAGYGLSFSVTSMAFDPDARMRHVRSRLEISDAEGELRFAEEATMSYACVDADGLARLAAQAGLVVHALQTGFRPGQTGELVAVLAPL